MNASIELWRFIFTAMVCFLHFNDAYFKGKSYFGGGYTSVEFFFILSGFLLMYSFEKRNDRLCGENTSLKYISHRIKSFYPHYIFSFIILFSYTMAVTGEPLIGIPQKLLQSFWEISMLHMSGIKCSIYNFPTWYISALIIVSYIIYYLLMNNEKLFVNIIAPVSVILIYGYYSAYTGHIAVWDKMDYVIKAALLRAFAGISLGCLCYKLYKKMKKYINNKNFIITLNIIEILSFCFAIRFMTLKKLTQNDFIIIVALALGVTISFLTGSTKYNGIKEKILIFLGRLSYPIFLNHIFIRNVLSKYIPGKGEVMFLVFIIILILYSFITDKFVKVLLNLIKNVFNKSKTYLQ